MYETGSQAKQYLERDSGPRRTYLRQTTTVLCHHNADLTADVAWKQTRSIQTDHKRYSVYYMVIIRSNSLLSHEFHSRDSALDITTDWIIPPEASSWI